MYNQWGLPIFSPNVPEVQNFGGFVPGSGSFVREEKNLHVSPASPCILLLLAMAAPYFAPSPRTQASHWSSSKWRCETRVASSGSKTEREKRMPGRIFFLLDALWSLANASYLIAS
jgi:hypothetical protein